MNRLMIVARLVEGAHEDAEALIAKGPPFDPDDLGFHRHAAYLTAGEVVFLFEGPQVEWILNDVIDDPIVAETFGLEGPHRGDTKARSRALLLVTRRRTARRRARFLGGLVGEKTARQCVTHEFRSARSQLGRKPQ